MNNPFLADGTTRLQQWKLVRQEISQLTDPILQIDTCLAFFKQAGLENYYLDWDQCQSWPAAWDLMWDNHFCPSGLSLAVAYTLMLCAPETFEPLRLSLVLDRHQGVHKIVVDWNNWYINYNYLDRIAKPQLKTSLTLNEWIYSNKSWHQQ